MPPERAPETAKGDVVMAQALTLGIAFRRGSRAVAGYGFDIRKVPQSSNSQDTRSCGRPWKCRVLMSSKRQDSVNENPDRFAVIRVYRCMTRVMALATRKASMGKSHPRGCRFLTWVLIPGENAAMLGNEIGALHTPDFILTPGREGPTTRRMGSAFGWRVSRSS